MADYIPTKTLSKVLAITFFLAQDVSCKIVMSHKNNDFIWFSEFKTYRQNYEMISAISS